MIFKVYTFFNELSSEEVRAKIEFSECQELTARACNVSVSTVARVLKRENINYRTWCTYLYLNPLVNTLGSKNKLPV
jgi:hypothetical protein